MKQTTDVITVLGAGYVGLTTAAILANSGYRVFAVEPNFQRLEAIKKGRSFFYEQGLDALIGAGLKAGTLIPTDSYEASIPSSSFVFSCVGTPDNPDGSSNLTYVFSAAESAAALLQPKAIYIQKSTVPVGTGSKIERLFADKKLPNAYVSNPEFLREGTALADSLFFDRIVVGGQDKAALERVVSLYKQVETCREELARLAGLERVERAGAYITTNLNSAELIKVTSNAFLALKISFANSIAKLADETEADINEVMDAVGADWRIGRAFLNAGRGYGGGCFPKDVSGLISSASDYGVDLSIMTAAAEVNDSMPGYIAHKAQRKLGGLAGKRFAVLGLSFKAGTSDARRSAGVRLANILSHSKASVHVYDPEANEEARSDLRKDIVLHDSAEAAYEQADAVFVATAWPQLVALDLAKLKAAMNGTLLVDCENSFTIADVTAAGLQYMGIGRKTT